MTNRFLGILVFLGVVFMPHPILQMQLFDIVSKWKYLMSTDIQKPCSAAGKISSKFCSYGNWFVGRRVLNNTVELILHNNETDSNSQYYVQRNAIILNLLNWACIARRLHHCSGSSAQLRLFHLFISNYYMFHYMALQSTYVNDEFSFFNCSI